jgi:transposase-like protein
MQTTAPGWEPPHCPNPNCPYHNANGRPWPYRKHGFYGRLTPPRRIQRFTCRHCHRAFSSQTFSCTYWLRRPDVLPALLLKCVGGMANRQIARDLRVAPTTVDGQLGRLGRHCLLFHRQQLRDAPPPPEIAIDGFETYELSQYYPTHFHLALEPDTSFLTHFTDSELRRKGRMTAGQKRRRQQLEQRHGRPDPQAVLQDVTALLQTVLEPARTAVIRSDQHAAYPRAIARLRCQVEHRTVRSRATRDRHNPLWEINRMDRMLRHSQAGHTRETLAWPKRRQRAAERLAVFVV